MKKLVAVLGLCTLATGCAFFDAPLDDPMEPVQVPANTSAPAQNPTSGNVATASAPAANTTQPAQPQSPSYLVVAPIERFPEDATNIAVVHLTNRSTNRDLALCKALMRNSPAVDIQDVPVGALTVIVWPVPNDNAGANCIEMISDYEPIEITADAAKKVQGNAAGPFLLSRHLASGKRMIYDLSFTTNSALSSTVNRWLTLLGSDPANWPDYRRAQ